MNLSGQHPNFGGGAPRTRNRHSAAVHARLSQFSHQSSARLIIAEHRDQSDLPSQRCEVGRAVARASRSCFGVFVSQNEDLGLTRNPADLAIDKLVSNHVADYDNRLTRETVDYISQVV